MSERKRKILTLEEKIKVIKFIDQGNSERKTANEFKISKGQIGNIKKRRAEYLGLYEGELAQNDIYRKVRSAKYEEVNSSHLISTILKELQQDHGVMGIQEDKVSDSDSEEGEGENEKYCPTHQEAEQMSEDIKYLTTIKERVLLNKICTLELKFYDIQTERVLQKKQTTLEKYFA